ncbi:GspH/FimT family pseudopilin [Chromatiaceae bacterium AAb-1]|nr:GspH/FimT family pseudopilin [Chromatiaceae bacterium AAb-1]
MRQSGFTFTELLISLLITGIILATGLPALTEFINRQRADSYLSLLSQHLSYARVMAASSDLRVRLCPGTEEQCLPDWTHYPLRLNLLNQTGTAVLLQEIPPVYSQHRLHYNRAQLSFRKDGSLDALENGTFYYCPQPHYLWHYRLTVSQAGRQRLSYQPAACPPDITSNLRLQEAGHYAAHTDSE